MMLSLRMMKIPGRLLAARATLMSSKTTAEFTAALVLGLNTEAGVSTVMKLSQTGRAGKPRLGNRRKR
jgi:hypothetical protein